MVSNFVDLIYCLLFGLIRVSIGQHIGMKTGSDVLFVIDFQNNPDVCEEIQVCFSVLEREPPWPRNIMSFSEKGDTCLGVASKQYQKRISYQRISFPSSLSFVLLNVSLRDTGKYYAKPGWTILGKRILFVTDQMLPACTGRKVEFEFALPSASFTEAIDVMFYYSTMQPSVVIQVADPRSGVCTTYIESLQCRINEYRLYITIRSVHNNHQGIYAFIGHGSRVVHESAILYVTDCTVFFGEDRRINVTKVQEDTISKDQTCTVQKEYFIGGGVVAGIVLVILTSIFIYKRCRREQSNVASDGAHDNAEVHYYSNPRIEDQGVSDSVDRTRVFQESQERHAFTVETNVPDETRFGIDTQASSKATKPFQLGYITPY